MPSRPRLLIVSTDRISAFDYVLPSLIPDKGKVLNQISAFWFRYTADLIPNHMISAEPEKREEFKEFSALLEKRAILAKKVKPFPVEAIVKQNPAGTTTVGIGEPFTYTLNVPVLYDPATGTFLDRVGRHLVRR